MGNFNEDMDRELNQASDNINTGVDVGKKIHSAINSNPQTGNPYNNPTNNNNNDIKANNSKPNNGDSNVVNNNANNNQDFFGNQSKLSNQATGNSGNSATQHAAQQAVQQAAATAGQQTAQQGATAAATAAATGAAKVAAASAAAAGTTATSASAVATGAAAGSTAGPVGTLVGTAIAAVVSVGDKIIKTAVAIAVAIAFIMSSFPTTTSNQIFGTDPERETPFAQNGPELVFREKAIEVNKLFSEAYRKSVEKATKAIEDHVTGMRDSDSTLINPEWLEETTREKNFLPENFQALRSPLVTEDIAYVISLYGAISNEKKQKSDKALLEEKKNMIKNGEYILAKGNEAIATDEWYSFIIKGPLDFVNWLTENNKKDAASIEKALSMPPDGDINSLVHNLYWDTISSEIYPVEITGPITKTYDVPAKYESFVKYENDVYKTVKDDMGSSSGLKLYKGKWYPADIFKNNPNPSASQLLGKEITLRKIVDSNSKVSEVYVREDESKHFRRGVNDDGGDGGVGYAICAPLSELYNQSVFYDSSANIISKELFYKVSDEIVGTESYDLSILEIKIKPFNREDFAKKLGVDLNAEYADTGASYKEVIEFYTKTMLEFLPEDFNSSFGFGEGYAVNGGENIDNMVFPYLSPSGTHNCGFPSAVGSFDAPRSGGRRHKGVDIGAPTGEPLYACVSGTVVENRWQNLGGYQLSFQDVSGYVYTYLHLQKASDLQVGQEVKAGQIVAYTGGTGSGAGEGPVGVVGYTPHLHISIRDGSGYINPTTALQTAHEKFHRGETILGPLGPSGNITGDSYGILHGGNVPSADRINAVLATDAPLLSGLGGAYYEASVSSGIDVTFLMAVSFFETGYGKSKAAREKNNIFGIWDDKNKTNMYFESKERCIAFSADMMVRLYINEGLTDIASFAFKYCKPNAENDTNGTNHLWPSSVSSIMAKIKARI